MVPVTLQDGMEERRRFSNEEKDPMTSKELNDEPYEVKISCTIMSSGNKGDLSVDLNSWQLKPIKRAMHTWGSIEKSTSISTIFYDTGSLSHERVDIIKRSNLIIS